MPTIYAYAAQETKGKLGPIRIERREPRPDDVAIEIAYCGLCHSDVHQVRDEWGNAMFPMVPGHEIVGTVSAVGSSVKRFKVGDHVGVGCLVDSCGKCKACQEGLEQYCENGWVGTYNAKDYDGNVTYGGYSQSIVVKESFVLRIPDGMDLARTAPLLCAGITTYSPLKHWKVGAGAKVGVVGLGGLGHMAVKNAVAMGAEVTVITRTDKKKDDAHALGAVDVIATAQDGALAKHANRFDFLIDTVSAKHDYAEVLGTVRRDGVMCIVGAPDEPSVLPGMGLVFARRSLVGSLIGGIAETQEMLDFCAKHGVLSDIELVRAPALDGAYDRMVKGDVKYRFVLDAKSVAS